MLMEVFKVIQREVEQGGFIVIIWVFYHGGVQAVGKIVNTPLESEMQAILMAIQHAWSRGFSKLCIESDSKKVVDIFFFFGMEKFYILIATIGNERFFGGTIDWKG